MYLFAMSTTIFAVIIVLHIMQKTSRISVRRLVKLPTRTAAPLSINLAANVPMIGERTITLLS
jgi:preprotein translocase subunit SecY